jgi:hypothetical protein
LNYRRQRRCCGAGGPQQMPGRRVSEISYHSLDGAKFKRPSMSIKFDGMPPF